jgi:hypothetical protein
MSGIYIGPTLDQEQGGRQITLPDSVSKCSRTMFVPMIGMQAIVNEPSDFTNIASHSGIEEWIIALRTRTG